jgi:hypothetical protein
MWNPIRDSAIMYKSDVKFTLYFIRALSVPYPCLIRALSVPYPYFIRALSVPYPSLFSSAVPRIVTGFSILAE